MIARLWRGRVAAARAAEYRVYQEEVGPPGYRPIPGIRRIYMLGRDLGREYEIAMLTFWDSLDAIRAFAGDPVDRARYYQRDFDFLIDPPERVEHFEVLTSANLAPGAGERERIVRLWRGRTPAGRRQEATRLETEIGVPGYLAVPGNAGVFQLGRDLGGEYELAMLTLWESWEAVRAFAGDPVDRASYDDYRRRGLDYLSTAHHKYAGIRAPLHPQQLRCAPRGILNGMPQSRASLPRRSGALRASPYLWWAALSHAPDAVEHFQVLVREVLPASAGRR